MATRQDDVSESEDEEEETIDQTDLSPELLEKKRIWKSKQIHLKSQLITADSPDVKSWKSGRDLFANLNYVGGVDISFVKGTEQACAMLTILSFPDLQVLHVSKAMVTMTEPYIPGFLAFREVGFLMDRLKEVVREKPELVPQVILVDGNGILHPAGLGLASHLGVLSGIPCIGVAKKLFNVDGLSKSPEFKYKVSKLLKKGDYFDLRGDSGKILGRAIRTSDDACNPVFVSIGHKLSLETATKLVLECSHKRIPEPTRQADLLSRDELRPAPPKKK